MVIPVGYKEMVTKHGVELVREEELPMDSSTSNLQKRFAMQRMHLFAGFLFYTLTLGLLLLLVLLAENHKLSFQEGIVLHVALLVTIWNMYVASVRQRRDLMVMNLESLKLANDVLQSKLKKQEGDEKDE